MNLPDSALPTCLDCGSRINPDAPEGRLMAREVIGFSIPRFQGGQNHVLGRRETGAFLCPTCTRALQTGHPGQAVIA